VKMEANGYSFHLMMKSRTKIRRDTSRQLHRDRIVMDCPARPIRPLLHHHYLRQNTTDNPIAGRGLPRLHVPRRLHFANST
jgi:hypothetical protein